jgi:hypothetical protein
LSYDDEPFDHSALTATQGRHPVHRSAQEPIVGCSLETLTSTPAWKKLSSRLKQVLTFMLEDHARSMENAVARFQPHWSPSEQRAAAEKILALPDVKECIALLTERVSDNDPLAGF